MPKLKFSTKIIVLACALAFCALATAWSQSPDSLVVEPSPFDILPEGPSSKLSSEALRESVEILCDPIFAGRATGTDGARYASQWIRDMFEDAGLMPFEENWYHEFPAGPTPGRNIVGYLPPKSVPSSSSISSSISGSNHSTGTPSSISSSNTSANYSSINPGSDYSSINSSSKTAGKWIVVGAYYDGLGVMGGKTYPGADSNASGVAALIAVANAVRRDCSDGIIFVAFDARSRDFAGARHMLSELKAAGITPRLMVSLDILGSTLSPVSLRNPRSLMALGGRPWSKILRKCASIGKLDLYFDYYKSESFTNLFYQKIGDQTVFMKAGIPSVVFTSGITLNTNKVTDTPETLDYEALRSRVLAISRWLSLIASGN